LRGTPEGKAMGFCLRTTFAFSAINPLGMSVADESRIVMLELMQHDQDEETARLIERELAYFRRQQGAWCSVMVSRASLVPKAVERFERSLPAGDRRHRQNMSALLAGAFVALYGEVPNERDLAQWAEHFGSTIQRHAEEQERDDAQECLDHLLGHIVRSHLWPDYPLRHWLAVAIGEEGDWLSEARRILDVYDMRIVWPDEKNKVGWLYIRNGAVQANEAYARTRWSDGGWMKALRKLPGAGPVERPVKFDTSHKGKTHRATKIPLDYIPAAIGSASNESRAAARW
jgi:hypothetical protein